MSQRYTIQETFEQLKQDFLTWATNNLNKVVPITRKINGKELREDITLSAQDIDFSMGESGAQAGSLQAMIAEINSKLDEKDQQIADLQQEIEELRVQIANQVTFEWNEEEQKAAGYSG